MDNACVRRLTVAENLILREFDRPPFVTGKWFLNRRMMREAARGLIARYRIVAPGPDAPAEVLSGGNVQRMVLARELSGPVEVLVAANPCFGLDIASTAEIRAQIMEVRNRGAAILLVSEDLDELLSSPIAWSSCSRVGSCTKLRLRWPIGLRLGATW